MASKGQPKTKLRIVPSGNRTIAGHQGDLYKVYGLNDEKPNEPTEVVLTKEPAMQPAGLAMEQFSISSVLLLAPMIGEAAGEMIEQMRTIFSYGAPLDMGRFKLTSIENIAIPASVATLPAPPETVDQLVASLRTSVKPAN
jgi:hypothetical protein